MKKQWIIPVAICALSLSLRADFSYEQESEITGGFLKSAMGFAGAFSKKANQPIRSKIVVKGSRMADIQDEQITVTDLDAETITTIHPKKKQYSVVTFEQMRQYMDNMAAKVREKKEAQDVKMEFDVKVEQTGESKEIEGRSAEAFDIRMKFRGQNPQSGESGEMQMLVKSWMTEPVAGYQEMQDFYRRMAEKLNWAPNSAMAMMTNMAPGSGESMAKVIEEMSKMKGMPILQETAMGSGEVQLGQSGQGGQSGQAESVDVGKELKKSLGSLGGFGGFGKKKKEAEEPPAQEPQQAESAAASANLLEMQVRYRNFSDAGVDAALVDNNPAGFKQVKSEIEKQLD